MESDSSMDDDEAIGRSLAGDLSAYEALVARYSALAHRTAAMLGAGDEAEDVVQEAFVKAYRHLPSFRRDSPFRPWLLRIVANETHNLTRSRGPQIRARRYGSARRPTRAARDDPEGAAVATDRRARLLEAVRTPAGTGTPGGRLPVLLTAVGGGDRPGARLPDRHRQVQDPPRPGPAAGRRWRDELLDDLEAELAPSAESLDVPGPPPDRGGGGRRARLEAAPPRKPGPRTSRSPRKPTSRTSRPGGRGRRAAGAAAGQVEGGRGRRGRDPVR